MNVLKKLFLSLILINILGFYTNASGKLIEKSSEIVLGNNKVKLRYVRQEENISLREIINLQTGSIIQVKNDDFQINLKNQEPLNASGFKFLNFRKANLDTKQTLVFEFQHKQRNMDLHITYSLGNDDFFVRRQLALTTAKPLNISQVDTWKLEFEGDCIFQEEGSPAYPHPVWGFGKNKGFGQPVFFDHSFWGLEYPAGYNQYKDGTLTLTHFPGKTFNEKYISKSAVFGLVGNRNVEECFKEYLDSISAIPSDKKPLFINYNTWETLMPPTEKKSLDMLELMSEKLIKPYNVRFDTYTFDDGWDDKKTLWDIRKDRFPNGFHSVKNKLQKEKLHLGLWLSPSSGYDHGPWLVKQGYPQNGTRGKFICQSDPRYAHNLSEKINTLINDYDIRFFKYDGICFNCDAENHNHLPGDYSKEANVDALIELLKDVRTANPDVYIDLTCGMWLSPWWLQYSSSVWGELYDGPPEPIVPTPYKGYGRITTRDAMILKRDSENPGFPMSAMENLGVFTPYYETMYDEVMAVMGRGSRLLTFYLDPYELLKTEKDWEFLAKAIKWAQENDTILINTKILSGNPLNKEPYGYAHFKNNRGIIVVYNPFIAPKEFSITLNEESGWQNNTSIDLTKQDFNARVVYPYNQVLQTDIKYNNTIDINLEGHEMLIVHIESGIDSQPILTGGRYEVFQEKDNKTGFHLYGASGAVSNYKISNIRNEDIKIEGDYQRLNKDTIEIHFPGKADSVQINNPQIELQSKDNGKNRLTGSCNLVIPEGTEPKMHILFSPVVPSAYKPDVRVLINGVESEYTVSFPPLETPHIRVFEEMPISDWNYYSLNVPTGESEIEFIIDVPVNETGTFKASLGCWLWSEQELALQTINIDNGDKSKRTEQKNYPLAVHNHIKREVKTIIPLRFFSKGIRKIAPAQQQVYLDDILPDEVAMSKMQLQVSKNALGSKLTIAKQEYKRGIGMHSYGRIKYNIEGLGFKKFISWVGVDNKADEGNIEFEVWLDGKRTFSSGLMSQKCKARRVEIEINKAKMLELRVLGGGDGIEGDLGNWCDAKLLK
ncbi:NPCBM/NEW2 domain-containing protein [Sunxiuqinia rutila]|uniref:NPCBM/NEW2 domain-containing protein n=1 Tax=Sunxiuqinia rutila TaxID=1397841 RepID=UPI003D364B3D